MDRSKEIMSSGKGYIIVGLPEQIQEYPLDFSVIEKLIELYSLVSKWEGFPRDKCVPVVGKALELGLGLHMEDGKFRLDKIRRRPRLWLDMPHTWLKDDNGIYYELTGEQFNKGLHTRFKKGVTVIYPGTELYKRYTTRQQLARRASEGR